MKNVTKHRYILLHHVCVAGLPAVSFKNIIINGIYMSHVIYVKLFWLLKQYIRNYGNVNISFSFKM